MHIGWRKIEQDCSYWQSETTGNKSEQESKLNVADIGPQFGPRNPADYATDAALSLFSFSYIYSALVFCCFATCFVRL